MQELALKNERGLNENPLKISWLEGQPECISPASRPDHLTSPQVSHGQLLQSQSCAFSSAVEHACL